MGSDRIEFMEFSDKTSLRFHHPSCYPETSKIVTGLTSENKTACSCSCSDSFSLVNPSLKNGFFQHYHLCESIVIIRGISSDFDF